MFQEVTETDPKFARDCAECERVTDVRLSFWDRIGEKTLRVCEDDGALIIRKGGVRCIFHLDQDATMALQNERITKVLTFLKLEKWLPKVLYSAEALQDEEDDICPFCGNPRN